MDFASILHHDFDLLMGGVNSLPLAVQLCDAFVSPEHEEYWSGAWCLAEVVFALQSNQKRDFTIMHESYAEKLLPHSTVTESEVFADGGRRGSTLSARRELIKPENVRKANLTSEDDRRKILFLAVQSTKNICILVKELVVPMPVLMM